MRDTLNYFDGINFAPLIRCPMRLNLGESDDVCPPETGMAVYEALGGPRELRIYEGCGHDAGSFWDAPLVADFLAKHLRPAAALVGA